MSPSYPEINVEIASTAKLAVANLERHSHNVILVQFLVETFASVGRQDDVVSGNDLESRPCGQEGLGGEELHCAGRRDGWMPVRGD